MFNIEKLKYRTKVPVYLKEIKEKGTCNTVRSKTIKKYRYLKCDYCNDEIRLDIKESERSGGIATLPHSLTGYGDIEVALCNKCIKKAVKDLEKICR